MSYITLFLLVIILIVAVTLFVRKVKKKKEVLAALLGIIGIGILLYNTVFYYNEEELAIMNAQNEEVAIHIPCHELFWEHYFARFNSKLSEKELKKELSKTYKNICYDEKAQGFLFTYDNNLFRVKKEETTRFLWMKRNGYVFACKSLAMGEELEYAEIPFPIWVIDKNNNLHGKDMQVVSSYEEIKPYYYINNIVLDVLKVGVFLTISIPVVIIKLVMEKGYDIWESEYLQGR